MRSATRTSASPPQYLQKLENPPFYFCYMPQSCMVTFGGIRTNRKMEVVDKNGQPVPGLYSAGVDSADLWPNIYTINVPGGTNANNINSGRFASKSAAEYIGSSKAGSVSSEGDTSESVPDVSWSMPESALKDGVYTDTQFGMFSDITVTVTVEGGKIAEISQENELETTYVGQAAMENTLIPAVIEQQTPAVDTVSGATRTSDAFRTAVQNVLRASCLVNTRTAQHERPAQTEFPQALPEGRILREALLCMQADREAAVAPLPAERAEMCGFFDDCDSLRKAREHAARSPQYLAGSNRRLSATASAAAA